MKEGYFGSAEVAEAVNFEVAEVPKIGNDYSIP